MVLQFGRGRGPRPSRKGKKKKTLKQQKNMAGRGDVLFVVAVWAGGKGGGGACLCFCCLGGPVRLFFPFFLPGWGRLVFFVLLFGQGVMLFVAVWAGDVFLFWLFGGGTGVHTYGSAWLVSKGPNNKKDQTEKTKKCS